MPHAQIGSHMDKIPCKTIAIIVFMLISALSAQSAIAMGILIPGHTPEEREVTRLILKSYDEYYVYGYLTDPSAVVRATACTVLSQIGTSYSLSALLALATDEEEDYRVREEASFALWNIRCRETYHESDKKNLLLSLIDIYISEYITKNVTFESDNPFVTTQGNTGWQVGVDPDHPGQYNVYWQQSTSDKYSASVLDDVVLESNMIEFTFKLNHDNGIRYDGVQFYFGMDESYQNGYVFLLENNAGINHRMAFFKVIDGEIDRTDESLGVTVIEGLDVSVPHRISINTYYSSMEAWLVDYAIRLEGLTELEGYTQGGIALGTSNLSAPAWFDEVYLSGSNIKRDYTDQSKTPRVIRWAMELLVGSEEALPLLQNFVSDTEITPFSGYLKEIAEISRIKTNFIISYSTPEEAIESGLVHDELYIRQLALNLLVKQNSPDLADRLNGLLQTAQEAHDNEFTSYIAGAIEDLEKEPFIIFEHPKHGATVKGAYTEIIGYMGGDIFYDEFELSLGKNTYEKTYLDKDGVTQSETIDIYRIPNAEPVLSPIGDQQVMVGQTLNVNIFATDADDTNPLYFIYGEEADDYELPEGAVFDYETQTFSWTPQAADIGTHDVTFEVKDGWGLTDRVTITINVTGQYQLTGRDILSGSGSITIDPDQDYYDDGTIITLTAVPGAGHEFHSWASDPHDLVYQSPTTELEIHQDTYISVFFKPITTDVYLNLPEGANGCYFNNSYYTSSETITGVAAGQYSLSIDYDSNSWLFSNWSVTSGDGSINDTSNYLTTIYITGTSPVTIEASLLLQQWQITGRDILSGSGSITIDPDQEYYTDGTIITLTAVPDAGHEFYSWSSDPYNLLQQTETTTLEIHQDTYVSVFFNPIPQAQTIPTTQVNQAPLPATTEASPTVIRQTASFDAEKAPVINQQPDCSIKIEPHRRNKYRFRFTPETRLSQRKIKSYLWDFGDGKTSKWRKVWHRYKKPGTYTVSFTVVDKNGEELKAKTETIVIPEH